MYFMRLFSVSMGDVALLDSAYDNSPLYDCLLHCSFIRVDNPSSCLNFSIHASTTILRSLDLKLNKIEMDSLYNSCNYLSLNWGSTCSSWDDNYTHLSFCSKECASWNLWPILGINWDDDYLLFESCNTHDVLRMELIILYWVMNMEF